MFVSVLLRCSYLERQSRTLKGQKSPGWMPIISSFSHAFLWSLTSMTENQVETQSNMNCLNSLNKICNSNFYHKVHPCIRFYFFSTIGNLVQRERGAHSFKTQGGGRQLITGEITWGRAGGSNHSGRQKTWQDMGINTQQNFKIKWETLTNRH